MTTEREADFESMIAYALSQHKRELAELAKKHPTDGQAASRVARGLVALLPGRAGDTRADAILAEVESLSREAATASVASIYGTGQT